MAYIKVQHKQSGGARPGAGRKEIADKKKLYRIYLRESRIKGLVEKYGEEEARKMIEKKANLIKL
jgi:hypothetical protein